VVKANAAAPACAQRPSPTIAQRFKGSVSQCSFKTPFEDLTRDAMARLWQPLEMKAIELFSLSVNYWLK
jgi:hypothetical protein